MADGKGPPALDTRDLEALLATRPAEVAERIRRTVHDVRPCVEARSVRVSDRPLRVGAIGRMFGRRASPPRLTAMASKFGGIPYTESGNGPGNVAFLGQINFAEAAAELAMQGSPHPAHMPHRGILALDTAPGAWGARVRWYPTPDLARHVDSDVASTGSHEAAICFSGGWSLQGLDWYAAVPDGDDELMEWLIDFDRGDADGHHHERYHKLFGHTDEILNEFFDIEQARPGSEPKDYIQVCRITFDNPAGFSWGTNWLYVLLHRDDLAIGDFGRSIVMVANA